MNLLLNTSNLHVGGGIQVATSVLSEISKSGQPNPEVSVVLSSAVRESFGDETRLSRMVGDVVVMDVKGFDLWNRRARKLMDRYTRVFTVFGPLYRWNPPFESIVGFAQPWIIYPDNECYAAMSRAQRIRTRLKFWVQAQFFKRADRLVVELEHVKIGLVRELGINPDRIEVVHNSLSGIYADPTSWEPVIMPPGDGFVRLGFVGRNYLHKNTAIFPEIAAQLSERYGVAAKFYVTFTEDEWQATNAAFREICINVGTLSPAQCPSFYRSLDAVVFPSLLECFSATPLEAMAMGIPLVASDRPFNRDVCGNHARYFDPLRPSDAAHMIADVLSTKGSSEAILDGARKHAFSFSTPTARARDYLALLKSQPQ